MSEPRYDTNQTGVQRFQMNPPFKGVVTDFPPPLDPSSWDDVVNFFVRKGRLQTRPKLIAFGAPPDGAMIRATITFQDATLVFHTVVLTTKTVYYWMPGPVWTALTPASGAILNITGLPYALALILNRLYFCNGSAQLLYTDGESTLKDAGAGMAFRYLAVNVNHLIGACATVPQPGQSGSAFQPNLVAWSKSGDPNVWTGDFTAGSNPLTDVPDTITGLFTIGYPTYIARQNGFTTMWPTGLGTAPFSFENLAVSPRGEGVFYPYSLAQYGNRVAFISEADVLVFNGDAFNSISPALTGVKKQLFKDIENSFGDQIQGQFVPTLGMGYDLLSYWITIPGVDISWVYLFDEGTWNKFSSVQGYMTSLGSVATT